MRPTFDKRWPWQQARAVGQRWLFILSLLLGLGLAQADTTNFVGDFGPAFWSLQPQSGSVFFTNADTELVLTGPNPSASRVNPSLDGILYNGPLAGGLRVGGTVEFHWEYNPGTVNSASADVSWQPSSGGQTTQAPLLLNGGLGFASGDFSTNLLVGTVFEFLLTTDTWKDKLSGSLIITDFQFHEVPEPSTGALLASAVISLGAACPSPLVCPSRSIDTGATTVSSAVVGSTGGTDPVTSSESVGGPVSLAFTDASGNPVSAYLTNSGISVTMTDIVQNTNASTAQTVTVSVTNLSNDDVESVTLRKNANCRLDFRSERFTLQSIVLTLYGRDLRCCSCASPSHGGKTGRRSLPPPTT